MSLAGIKARLRRSARETEQLLCQCEIVIGRIVRKLPWERILKRIKNWTDRQRILVVVEASDIFSCLSENFTASDPGRCLGASCMFMAGHWLDT